MRIPKLAPPMMHETETQAYVERIFIVESIYNNPNISEPYGSKAQSVPEIPLKSRNICTNLILQRRLRSKDS